MTFKQLATPLIVVLSAVLFSVESHAVDFRTVKFMTDKAERLAAEGKYAEALDEIAWLLRDASGRAQAEEVLRKFPSVAKTRIESLNTMRLTELSCEKDDQSIAKQEAVALIEEVATYADSEEVAYARAKVNEFFEKHDLGELKSKCKLAEQALAEAATRNAVAGLRTMDLHKFCAEYGVVIRGSTPGAYSSVRDLLQLFESEAKRRRVLLDKNLVKSERIRLGISQCALYASWGFPIDQNSSVGTWGTHIQHVYGRFGPYVYTENGRVTSWQQ